MSDKPISRKLRSTEWFGRQDRDGFAYRSWVKGKGVPHDQFDGRPVIGICNTFSELTPCNSHFRTLAEAVKVGAKALWLQQGVWSEDAAARATAGGLTVVMDACIAVEHAVSEQ